jgi:hypothetical protein
MHDLLSRTQYSWRHAYSAAPDFGEAPSQLLEFWCWIPERLKAMSLHYSYLSPEYKAAWIRSNASQPDQPPEKLPDDLIENMLKAKYVTQALSDLEQVCYGTSLESITYRGSHSHVTARLVLVTWLGSLSSGEVIPRSPLIRAQRSPILTIQLFYHLKYMPQSWPQQGWSRCVRYEGSWTSIP